MNTLNYKVLLIKISFRVFARAIGIYLLVTLPAMAAKPELYALSARYALGFGWIAGFFFLFLFYTIQTTVTGMSIKNILLYTAVALSVAIAFQAMELTGTQHHIWQSGAFLLFPAAAVISGWVSLAVSGQQINSLLTSPRYPAFDNSATSGKTIEAANQKNDAC